MIYWLQQRRQQGKSTPGMYLCWELMVGNSNCCWHWIDKPCAAEPEIPWCGLLWPDATPVSLAEAETMRRYTSGKSQAMFFEDFENHSAAAWRPIGAQNLSVRNAVTLDPNVKALAGEESWTDFVLEGRIALRSNEKNDAAGSAGLLFRVTCPERDGAELSGYEVAFDRNELVLNKQTDGKRQRLATYDLMKLENQPRMNEWNLLRIAADGARIRVWFNRMHPSSDPERGLRIDYTDKNDSVLSGAIGIGTHNVQAWYDDIVVLPIDALPQSRTGDRQ